MLAYAHVFVKSRKLVMAQRKTKGTPNEYDVTVGQRVRMLRTLAGWSQEKLADALGITFQQVQKYENGTNRIAAGRLYELALVMGLPINQFYPDGSGASALSDNAQTPLLQDDPLTNKETLELLRAYYGINNPALRKQFVALAKAMAENIEKSGGNAKK